MTEQRNNVSFREPRLKTESTYLFVSGVSEMNCEFLPSATLDFTRSDSWADKTALQKLRLKDKWLYTLFLSDKRVQCTEYSNFGDDSKNLEAVGSRRALLELCLYHVTKRVVFRFRKVANTLTLAISHFAYYWWTAYSSSLVFDPFERSRGHWMILDTW